MEEEQAMKVLNAMIEIFEANNLKLTGDINSQNLNYAQCFATLK